ncbi:hypothetical protein NDU88_007680 [Pleurodeles waltl]|uniref:Uncharacterized protein n=1 Tax=Pleurodeles waltl TaxID=8319 RepID=A0AAV7QPQ1_PLEWA|nr:hypothetical protein NDU88_007680 [Pleurodeles waltl]
MLLYLACLKEISGGRSHFFDRPEEVWHWLEIWDKAVPARTERARGVASQASGAERLNWRLRKAGSLEDTGNDGSVVDSIPRVEIQED